MFGTCSNLGLGLMCKKQACHDIVMTHLYLQANNDMYIWNQVNYIRNHYANLGMNSPYYQCSYPKVPCPRQFELSLADN